jgi:hypothetical protein
MAVSEALIDFGEDDNIGEEVFEDGSSHSPSIPFNHSSPTSIQQGPDLSLRLSVWISS